MTRAERGRWCALLCWTGRLPPSLAASLKQGCATFGRIAVRRQRNVRVGSGDVDVEKVRNGSFFLNVPAAGESADEVLIQRTRPIMRVQPTERGTAATVARLAPCHKQVSQFDTRAAFRPFRVSHNPAGRGNRPPRLIPVRLAGTPPQSPSAACACQLNWQPLPGRARRSAASSRKRFDRSLRRALGRNLARKALPSVRHYASACTPMSGAPGICPRELASDQSLSNFR
eukprot:1851677-Pleurochrysis_carterae.AAC.1